MARGKVTLAYINNASHRRASFRKRKKGILKKMNELSTLCGAEACAVIYNSAHDMEPEIHGENVLSRFESLSEIDKTSKMEGGISFMRQQVKKVEKQIRRIDKKNKNNEMERAMLDYLTGSPRHPDQHYTSEMLTVIDRTLEDINSRIDALKINGRDEPGVAMAGPSC